MLTIVFIFLGLICVAGLARLAIYIFQSARRGADSPDAKKWPFRRKDFLLTAAERSFFGVLQQVVGTRYLLFAKVRLADLVYLPKGVERRQAHQNRVNSKHIDFLLCDPATVRPLLAIELNDSSHDRPDRAERDELVNAILNDAGLPLLMIPARAAYVTREIDRRIRDMLDNR